MPLGLTSRTFRYQHPASLTVYSVRLFEATDGSLTGYATPQTTQGRTDSTPDLGRTGTPIAVDVPSMVLDHSDSYVAQAAIFNGGKTLAEVLS